MGSLAARPISWRIRSKSSSGSVSVPSRSKITARGGKRVAYRKSRSERELAQHPLASRAGGPGDVAGVSEQRLVRQDGEGHCFLRFGVDPEGGGVAHRNGRTELFQVRAQGGVRRPAAAQ